MRSDYRDWDYQDALDEQEAKGPPSVSAEIPSHIHAAVMEAVKGEPEWAGKSFSDVVTHVLDQWFAVSAEEEQHARYGH